MNSGFKISRLSELLCDNILKLVDNGNDFAGGQGSPKGSF